MVGSGGRLWLMASCRWLQLVVAGGGDPSHYIVIPRYIELDLGHLDLDMGLKT